MDPLAAAPVFGHAPNRRDEDEEFDIDEGLHANVRERSKPIHPRIGPADHRHFDHEVIVHVRGFYLYVAYFRVFCIFSLLLNGIIAVCYGLSLMNIIAIVFSTFNLSTISGKVDYRIGLQWKHLWYALIMSCLLPLVVQVTQFSLTVPEHHEYSAIVKFADCVEWEIDYVRDGTILMWGLRSSEWNPVMYGYNILFCCVVIWLAHVRCACRVRFSTYNDVGEYINDVRSIGTRFNDMTHQRVAIYCSIHCSSMVHAAFHRLYGMNLMDFTDNQLMSYTFFNQLVYSRNFKLDDFVSDKFRDIYQIEESQINLDCSRPNEIRMSYFMATFMRIHLLMGGSANVENLKTEWA